MPERISRARLERLRAASTSVANTPDPAAALEALRSKLGTMRERLLASDDARGGPDVAPDPVEQVQRLERAEAVVFEATGRLERELDDPATPEHVLEAALRDLRVARLRAPLAEIPAEGSQRK